MATSIAQFYLDIFRLGVRIEPSNLEIEWPPGLPPSIRDEVDARRQELALYLRRNRGLVVERSDVAIMRRSVRQLSRLRFDRNCLVSIRPGDLSGALFVPHSMSGLAAPAEVLSRLCPDGQAVLAFQARGLNDDGDPLLSIEEMATYYLTQMRSVDPHGPYFLCGWSLGGYIAFEMARQIYASGGQVGLLIIIDSRLPPPSLSKRGRWLKFYHYANYAEKMNELEVFDRSHAFWKLSDEDRLAFIFSTIKPGRDSVFGKNVTFEGMKRHIAYLNAMCDAQEKYQAQKFTGPLTFFRAQDCPESVVTLWSGLTSGVFQTIDIPGGHLSLMEHHNRGVVVEKLLECLHEARPESAKGLEQPANCEV